MEVDVGELIRVAGFGGLVVIVAKADTADAQKQFEGYLARR